MPKIRGNTAEKWSRRTASATQEFTEGVQNPRESWQAATLAAEKAHSAGVQQALTERRFQKGVAKAGDARWKEKTLSKGSERFAPGVQGAQADYAAGFAPFAQVIESTNLPPRGPKGDPKNYDRVRVMGEALRAKKKSL